MRKKQTLRLRRSRNGQTVVEWLMLMTLAFISGFIVVTGPVSNFAKLMLNTMRSSLVNVVQNAELRLGEQIEPGEGGHPSDPTRFRSLH